MFIFLAAAAGAGVVASYLSLACLYRLWCATAWLGSPGLSHDWWGSLGGWLRGKADMVYSVSYIMLDGGEKQLELLVSLVLVSIYSPYLA